VNCEFRCAAVTAGVRGLPVECGPSTDRLGFRSRPIADASGALLLRDRNWIGQGEMAGQPIRLMARRTVQLASK
jgi:hypothetical protein